MSYAHDHHVRQQELAALQEDFPGYRIWHESTGFRVRLVAVTRTPGTSPHTVVTTEAAELRAALASATPSQPGP